MTEHVTRRPAAAVVRAAGILALAGRRLVRGGGQVWAAALAFYALVSLFPLVLLLLSALGFIVPVSALAQRLIASGAALLPGAADLFRDTVVQLVASRGTLGLTAAVTLYWSASGVFAALSRMLDTVWSTGDSPRAAGGPAPASLAGVWRRLRALAVVLVVGILFLASVFATTYLHLTERVRSLPTLGPLGPEAARLVLWTGGALATATVFLAVYALVPSDRPPWRGLWPGALVSTALFEGAKVCFAWYADRLETYAWVYGSVTTPIVMLAWFYVVALIVIYGAEVGAATVLAGGWRPKG
ncbi:MAG: YihY/virulence factor BrkB family protein [Bacillota bacterium]|nr:MAG: YihY/virulence factor BrkB family protein [Bacillota bacterium]